MVTTNQKNTTHSQKTERNLSILQKKIIKAQKKKKKEERKTMIKMAISTCLSIITWTINEQNALIKRQREADWIEKTRTYNILPTRDSL